MSFQEYLEVNYRKKWSELCEHTDIVVLIQYAIEYEVYCRCKNVEPYWS